MALMQRIYPHLPGALRPPGPDGCTKDTRQCDFWNWGGSANRPECCTRHLIELASFAEDLLTSNDIVHWLDWGSLLGAVREQAFIAWDWDADFGILERDSERFLALEPQIARAGFQLDPKSPWGSMVIRYSAVNATGVEIVPWRERDGLLMSEYPSDDEWPGMHTRTTFPSRFIEHLEPVSLHGKPFPAPSPVHDFITNHRFGRDYMTPRRPIRWIRVPPIAPSERTPLVEELLEVIAEKDQRVSDLKATASLSRFYAWRNWLDPRLPLRPPRRHLERLRSTVPPAERTGTVEALLRSVAVLDQAILEFKRPSVRTHLGRGWRRVRRFGLLLGEHLRRRRRVGTQ